MLVVADFLIQAPRRPIRRRKTAASGVRGHGLVAEWPASFVPPMRTPSDPRPAALAAAPAFAEKPTASPLNVEADQPGRTDLAFNQHVVFNGNVVVTKGTMTIRAGRIEVRETPDGCHSAVASSARANKPATFRQKRATAWTSDRGRGRAAGIRRQD